MTTNNKVKKQHYIPEALLWHFVNKDDKFFEVLLRNKSIYPAGPNNSMCEMFVYEDDKLEVNTVENYFAKIDAEIAPAIKDLIVFIDKYKAGEIDIEVIKDAVEKLLSTFIVFYYRSGALLTEFSSFDKRAKMPALSKKILNFDYLNELAETIKNFYNFALIESSNDFLLSDQYVSTVALKMKSQFFDISNRHIGLKETLILIPISSSYYIAYWHSNKDFFISKNTINILKETELQFINQAIVDNSYKKCISTKKERIGEVLLNYNEDSPSQIFAGGNPEGFSMGAIKKKEVFLFEEDKQIYDLLQGMQVMKYKDLGRNDLCAYNSGKKFKKCHETVYEKLEIILDGFGKKPLESRNMFVIPGVKIIEHPIDHWSGFSKK